jgi:hypothetical protein
MTPNDFGKLGKFLSFLGLALIALGFGTWGFRILEPDREFTGHLYRSVQLFGLESGAVDGPTPPPLELARWLAPLTLAGGLIGLLSSLIGSKIQSIRQTRLIGHHIICGLGTKGMALAKDLLKDGEKVLAIDPCPDEGHLADFRKMGGLHIPLKATNPRHLQSCRIDMAATFTALTPNDACNLALTVGIAVAGSLRENNPNLTIFSHIGGVDFRDLLDRYISLSTAAQQGVAIRTFNAQANLARLLLEWHPLETAGHCDGATNTNRKIRLVLPALRAEAIALAVHAARTGHYLGGRKVHFHLVSSHALMDVERLRVAYPNFERCSASLNATATNHDGEFTSVVGDIIRSYPGDCITVFTDFVGSPDSIRDLLLLNEQVPQGMDFRIPMPVEMKPLLASLMSDRYLFGNRISWFPKIDDYCGKEAVFGGRLDSISKMIHDNWYSETDIRIRNLQQKASVAQNDNDRERALDAARALRARPAFKSWDDLSEGQKDSNRSQKDHIAIKVRAAGLDPVKINSTRWLTSCDQNPELLESLARIEHERWAAHLWLAGWKHGPRDDSQKLHDNLVPYDELDEETKDYDRNACRLLGKYLPTLA